MQSAEFSPPELDRVRTESFVRHVEFHRRLPSTNDRALKCAVDRAQTPALILAELQTSGRGRGANAWWANHGALTFSLLVDAALFGLAPARVPQLSLATALAVRDALDAHAPSCELQVKWPNDVYLSGYKVAGILLERAADRVVVGVGVNVNNSVAAAPEQVRGVATSLIDETGRHVPLADVLLSVLQAIADRYRMLATDPLSLAGQWRPHCLLAGRCVEVAVGTDRISGLCHGIDENGALLVDDSATRHHLVSGVVQQVIPPPTCTV